MAAHKVHRAGGHIDRGDGKGWVVDDSPDPEPPKERPRKPLGGTGPTRVGGWILAGDPEPEAVAEPEPEPDPEPEVAAAEPASRKRGRPRKNSAAKR